MTRKTFLTRLIETGFKKQRRTKMGRYLPSRRVFATDAKAVAFGQTVTRYGIAVIDLRAKTVQQFNDWKSAWEALR